MIASVLLIASGSQGFVASPAGVSRAAMPASPVINMVKGPVPDKNVWVTFANTKDIRQGEVISGFQYGQEIAIACTQKGELFALSNKLPPTGQPATLGTLEGDEIIDPIGGTSFKLKTGKVAGQWCPSILGKLIFGRLIKPSDVPVFKCRKQGGSVQVLINVNAKAQFESNYWRGVLDSQGKVDGGYY